jgi:hypothetical protein
MPMRIRARRLVASILAAGVLATASVSPALGVGVIGDGTDDKVTGLTCVRHDGGTDQAIAHCNDGSSNPAPDPTPNTDGDTDSNDGGNRRQGNEPFSVIDPTDPDTVIAGWNDYSQTDLGAGWQGFGYSRDGGETWVNSYVPGYPADTSAEGMASPLFRNDTEAGDPIAAFDNDGNLYVGGISFNRGGAINGHVYVARYDAGDVAVPGPDYPADYRFTRIVGIGTPSRNFQGIFQDKPMLEVDRTGGDTDGNVYVCWSRFTGFGQNKIYFSRSTNGGNTFSRPIGLTTHGFSGSVQGCDIAIEGDGDVYVTFRTFNDSSVRGENALYFVRSTNGGASFTRPHKVRNITPYNPLDGTRDCGDGPFVCPSEFVFARIPLEPRSTADQSSATDGIWLVYNEIDSSTVVDSDTTYQSAGGGRVGRSVVYVVKSTDDGATWSAPITPAGSATSSSPTSTRWAGRSRSSGRTAARTIATASSVRWATPRTRRRARTTTSSTRSLRRRPMAEQHGRASRSRTSATSRSMRCSGRGTCRSRAITTGSPSPTRTGPPPAGSRRT